MYQKIILNKGKESSLYRKHPWIFSGAILTKPESLNEGDIVEVYSFEKKYLATGFYAGGSIAVRIFSFQQEEVNDNFWFHKLNNALLYRKQFNLPCSETNVFRLFFGEGDGIPGLVIDNYDGNIVIQAHHVGIYHHRMAICEALKKIYGDSLRNVYDKSAESISGYKPAGMKNEFLYGAQQDEVEVTENGYTFKVNLKSGQKTGFFIDQRENRKLLSTYCKNKSVLNTFAYTGGFSVYASSAGASFVHSVDISQAAIDLCNKNIHLNKLQNHEAFVCDVFDFLKDKKDDYDMIVLDPPAFAKKIDSRHQAIKGYKRLNTLAIKQIKSGGIIFTFSCSGVVDKYLFYNTVTASAIEAGRNIKVLHYLSQPIDHPVLPFFPEGEYLKGMVIYVE